MTREQLEHIVRAAAYIVDDDELIVVGSQAVLGQFPDAPPALLSSNEADVTRGATGWCLEIHDLVVSKLAAGREKDLDFAREAARNRLVDETTLTKRLSLTDLPSELRPIVEGRVARLFGGRSDS